MNRLVLLVVVFLQISSIANAAPGRASFQKQFTGSAYVDTGYVQDTGIFLGNLFTNLGSYVQDVLHRAGDGIRIAGRKNIAAVSETVSGFSGGFGATFGAHTPNIAHRTRYVEVDTPVVYQKVIVPYESVGGVSAGFVAAVEKNVNERVPEIKYETEHVIVEKPIVIQSENVIEGSKGINAGLFATGSLGVQIPYAETAIVVEKQPQVENIIEKEVNVQLTQQAAVIKESPIFQIDVRKFSTSVVAKPALASAEVVKESYVKVAAPFVSVNVRKDIGGDAIHSEEIDKVIVFKKEVEREAPTAFVGVKGFASLGSLERAHVEIENEHVYVEKPKEVIKNIERVRVVHVSAPPTSVGVRKNIAGAFAFGVNAPFAHVATSNHGGSKAVRVTAPLTHVATSNHRGTKAVSVVAPFTSVKTFESGLSKDVHVRAPFVDVKTGSKGVWVRAPFVDVQTGPKDIYGRASLNLNVPFLNLRLR